MPFKSHLNAVLIDRWGNPLSSANISAQNAPKLSNDMSVIAKIVTEFQNRQRAEIQAWRRALDSAKNPEDQRMFQLQDLYENLESDGHYISERELRKAATLCSDFEVIDRATGDVDDNQTELFKEEWFYNFCENALDHFFKGCTVMQLIKPKELEFEVIPRRNVAPRLGRVYLEVGGNKFIDYTDPKFQSTIVTVGHRSNIGLMGDLCGQLIWKRNGQQAWADYSEKYGHPLITATSNQTNQSELDKLEVMLRSLGEAARAVLPEGSTVDIKQFTGGDSYQVYLKQLDFINTEISKPLVGGTMLTGEGSSRSQAEVHERNLDEKIAMRDKIVLSYIVNNQLLPIMSHWGHDINPERHRFKFPDTFELSLKEHWTIVSDALYQGMEIPIEWISKTFNMPINKRVMVHLDNFNSNPQPNKQQAKRGGISANFI